MRVRAVGEFRTSVEGLQRMIVSSTKVGWVSLDNLVTHRRGNWSFRHRSSEPTAAGDVAGNMRPGGSQAAVIQQMDQFAKEINIDPAYSDRTWRDVRKSLGARVTTSRSRSSCRLSSCTWCWRRSLSRSFTR